MRAAAAAGSSTRALAAAEGVRQRHWARGCAGQVARRADGARVAGDSAGNTALPVVPVRPQAAPYSVGISGVVRLQSSCVGRARLTKYRSACAGSGKNSVTGLIACHFTTRMRRRGRPRVCTNLFLFFRYVGPARAATAGPARSGSADAARGPTSYAGGAATWQGRRHPVTPPSPPQPRGPRHPAAAAAADPPPGPGPGLGRRSEGR